MITQEAVLDIAREAIYTTIITSAPLLLISLSVYFRLLRQFRSRHLHLCQK